MYYYITTYSIIHGGNVHWFVCHDTYWFPFCSGPLCSAALSGFDFTDIFMATTSSFLWYSNSRMAVPGVLTMYQQLAKQLRNLWCTGVHFTVICNAPYCGMGSHCRWWVVRKWIEVWWDIYSCQSSPHMIVRKLTESWHCPPNHHQPPCGLMLFTLSNIYS